MSNKEMKLIMEGWRGFINEEEQIEPQIKNVADQTIKSLEQLFSANAQKIVQKAEKQKAAQAQNKKLEEEGVLGTAGLILAIPSILELISFTAKKFKLVKDQPNFIDKFAHTLTKFYKKPIKFLLGLIPKLGYKDFPSDVQEKIADFVLIGIVAFFAYHSGVEAYKAAKAMKVGTTTYETFLAAIKGGEVSIFATRELTALIAGATASATVAARG
jgi:hypothetical protein